MRRRYPADARQPLHRPRLVRSGIHAVFRPQQASQQRRALGSRVPPHGPFPRLKLGPLLSPSELSGAQLKHAERGFSGR